MHVWEERYWNHKKGDKTAENAVIAFLAIFYVSSSFNLRFPKVMNIQTAPTLLNPQISTAQPTELDSRVMRECVITV